MHQDDLKEKDEILLFLKIVLDKIASVARNLINSSPQTEATTFAFSYVFILSSMGQGDAGWVNTDQGDVGHNTQDNTYSLVT